MSKIFQYKLSIITATYNAEMHLPFLIESLRIQSDKDFEWVIVDGVSNDNTLEIIKNVNDLNIKIISQEDFGIYDALNHGIKACNGQFYLVMGADDLLYIDGVKDYKEAINDNVDIVTAWVDTPSGFIMKSKRGPAWLSRLAHYISCHAVGSVYRTALHEKYGYYSNKFPITADQLFVSTICTDNVVVKHIQNIVGNYNNVGISSTDQIGALTEDYRVMLDLGFNKYIQTILFLWRLMKRIIATR